MVSISGNFFWPASAPGQLDRWGQVSQVMTHLNRSFGAIGRDGGPKSVSLGLSNNEREAIFSAGGGAIGQGLLENVLIMSAPRLSGPDRGPLINTNYKMTQLSTTYGHLSARRGPNLVRSSRIDTLV